MEKAQIMSSLDQNSRNSAPDDAESRQTTPAIPDRSGRRAISPAARRALAEAAERRRLADSEAARHPRQKEIGGRDGPDPIRYGDWEKRGIASDF